MILSQEWQDYLLATRSRVVPNKIERQKVVAARKKMKIKTNHHHRERK